MLRPKRKRVEILLEITANWRRRGSHCSGPVFIFDLPKLLIPPNYLETQQCTLTSPTALKIVLLEIVLNALLLLNTFEARGVIWAQRTGFRFFQLPFTNSYQIPLFVAFISIRKILRHAQSCLQVTFILESQKYRQSPRFHYVAKISTNIERGHRGVISDAGGR